MIDNKWITIQDISLENFVEGCSLHIIEIIIIILLICLLYMRIKPEYEEYKINKHKEEQLEEDGYFINKYWHNDKLSFLRNQMKNELVYYLRKTNVSEEEINISIEVLEDIYHKLNCKIDTGILIEWVKNMDKEHKERYLNDNKSKEDTLNVIKAAFNI